MSKSKFRCQGRTIVSSVVQKVPPKTGNLLLLCFNFAICPRRVAVRGRKVMPISFVPKMKSVLMKAVPRSCTMDWEIPKDCIDFSTAQIVAWTPVFGAGNTIKKQKRENASITKMQWRLWLLGGCRIPLWSKWIVPDGTASFCHSSNGTSFLCLGFC